MLFRGHLKIRAVVCYWAANFHPNMHHNCGYIKFLTITYLQISSACTTQSFQKASIISSDLGPSPAWPDGAVAIEKGEVTQGHDDH